MTNLPDRIEQASEGSREAQIDADFVEGYCDGRDADAPWPGPNRSAAYKHSFEVGRAELQNTPIPAAVSRKRAAALRAHGGEG